MKTNHEKDPNRIKSGRKSRRKGRKNEQELAKEIGQWFGYSIDTKDQESPNYYLNHCKRTARDRQKGMGDLWTSQELRAKFPWLIEAKCVEGWMFESLFQGKDKWLMDWWEQTVEEAKETGQSPLLVFTKNHSPWYIACSSDFYSATTFITHKFLRITRLADFLSKYYPQTDTDTVSSAC
jgi:hypothetical protein